jgi:hypothetical protein
MFTYWRVDVLSSMHRRWLKFTQPLAKYARVNPEVGSGAASYTASLYLSSAPQDETAASGHPHPAGNTFRQPPRRGRSTRDASPASLRCMSGFPLAQTCPIPFMSPYGDQPDVLWRPADRRFSRVEHFRRYVNHKHRLQLGTFQPIDRTSRSS